MHPRVQFLLIVAQSVYVTFCRFRRTAFPRCLVDLNRSTALWQHARCLHSISGDANPQAHVLAEPCGLADSFAYLADAAA